MRFEFHISGQIKRRRPKVWVEVADDPAEEFRMGFQPNQDEEEEA